MSTRRDNIVTGESRDDLWSSVLDELRRYRKEPIPTSDVKLAAYPTLKSLSGHPDTYDAYQWLLGTVRGFTTRADRNLVAAVKATFGPGTSVLERLESLADLIGSDQRTARRWADAGMEKLATALVDESHMTGMRGIHIIDFAYMATESGDCLLLNIRWRALKVALTGLESIRMRLHDYDDPHGELWKLIFSPEWVEDQEQDTVVVSSFFTELPVFPGDTTLEFLFTSSAPPFFNQIGGATWDKYFLQVTTHRQIVEFRWLNENARMAALYRFAAKYEDRLVLGDMFERAGVPIGSADFREDLT